MGWEGGGGAQKGTPVIISVKICNSISLWHFAKQQLGCDGNKC